MKKINRFLNILLPGVGLPLSLRHSLQLLTVCQKHNGMV